MARERNQRIIKGGTSGSGIGIGWPAGILPPGLPGLGTGVGGLGSSYDSGRVSERVAASVLDRLQPIEKLAKWFYLGLAVLIVVFATSVAANNGRQAWQAAGDFVLAVGCSFLIASGAAAVGCLLGFLFGIPRSRQGLHLVLIQAPPSGSGEGKMHSDEEGTPQLEQKKLTEPGRISVDHGAEDRGDSPFLINTSLEEISDWLTKIIIGLGLVQFQTLITYLNDAATYAASFVAHKNIIRAGGPGADAANTVLYDSALASPFFFALIITSLFSACFLSYLETRTRLTLLFVGALKREPGDLSDQQRIARAETDNK